MLTAQGSIGQLSPACGIPTQEVELRGILDRAETYSTKIAPCLFRHFERRYPYLTPVNPAAEECLLVPFYVAGKAVGTIWAIMHSDRRKFDAEDDRAMASLGKFASSAYQALVHIEDLKIQVAEREKAEAEVRKLASGLEAKIRRLVEANVVGIVIFDSRRYDHWRQ